MKKKLFITLLLLVFNSYSDLYSQSGWYIYSSLPGNNFHSLDFIDNNTAWVLSGGKILKTTNAGLNWDIQYSSSYGSFNKIQFVNHNTGWVVGVDFNISGSVRKTTNGGINWFNQLDGYWLRSVCFVNESTGWVTGTTGTSEVILKTTSGGSIWNVSLYCSFATLWSVQFVDANTGWIVGDSISNFYRGVILNTTNGGVNWLNRLDSPSCGGLTSLYFVDQNTGWVVGDDYSSDSGAIIKTTNGGENWLNQNYNYHGALSSVYFINPYTGWIVSSSVGVSQAILKTTNGGINWLLQPIANGISLKSVYFMNQDTGWAVGFNGFSSSGVILKTTTGGEPIGIKPISSEVPLVYSLSQNFPNPFNPSTRIKIEIPKSGNVKLVVYDVLGCEVSTLVNEELKPGMYKVDWNASNMPSGVYFYKLTTSDFTEIKRMVLVK